MASRPQFATHMELHKPEISQPQPLRIIKRSQTVTGSSASRELFWGRELSGCSDESFNIGSPPFGADRPLTVSKLRKKQRVSILTASLDEAPISSGDAMYDLVQKNEARLFEDPDLTPKARKPVPRKISAGAFLKSELHRGSSETDENAFLPFQYSSPPKIPERRPSKSKNFILKAIGGRGNNINKVKVRQTSSTSEAPLSRRNASRSSVAHSVNTLQSSRCYEDANQPAWMLVPNVTITPEVSSITGGICILWVAVTITGTLCAADGNDDFQHIESSDLGRYGKMFSMQIELLPARNCTITEIFGNLHDLKTVRVNETHLFLVKVRLGSLADSTSSASDKLIADLENHLGNTITPYLGIRITYKHSGFETEGLTTAVQSEITASIQRYNPYSTWVPTTPRVVKGPIDNPLITLIERYLPTEKARAAIHKLADERIQIPYARRQVGSEKVVGGSSEDTVKRVGSSSARMSKSTFSLSIDEIVSSSLLQDRSSDDSDFLNVPEMDPARKIWTEMRRTSRGRNQRRSLSASTFSAGDNDSNHSSPSRRLSDDTIESERGRIKQMALRNKRSVGADTLRSIAPSVAGSKKGPGTGGVGALGLGRNWGWTGSWWA